MIRPVDFKEANLTLPTPPVLEGHYPDDLPLHFERGQNVSCWRLSFVDRLRLLFTGRLFLGVVGGHPPVWMRTTNPFRPNHLVDETRKHNEEFEEELKKYWDS